MASSWKVIGQIGNVIEKNNCFLINIAENKYKPNKDKEWKKEYTIWFNCISDFKPKANTGDTVIAEGEYLPSKNEKYPYIMKIKHMGVIKRKTKESN